MGSFGSVMASKCGQCVMEAGRREVVRRLALNGRRDFIYSLSYFLKS